MRPLFGKMERKAGMNRRSFLALAASPLLTPLLAACRGPLPAKSYSVKPYAPAEAERLMAEIEGDNYGFVGLLKREMEKPDLWTAFQPKETP